MAKRKGHSCPTDALYGDVVTLLLHTTLVPLHGWMLYHDAASLSPERLGHARWVLAAMVLPILIYVPALAFRSLWLSRVAMASGLAFVVLFNLLEWPHENECVVTPMLQAGIMMGLGANISLSFREKMVRLTVIFIVGSCVSLQSPHSIYVEDTLPALGGTVILAVFVLYVYHFHVDEAVATVHGAQLVLASLFVYHTIQNLATIPGSPDPPHIHFVNTCKTVVLGAFGVIATGTFQKEIVVRERLEHLVRERTQEILDQNRKLRMVGMALEASETAIAITEESGQIVWTNAAFEDLCAVTGPGEAGTEQRGLERDKGGEESAQVGFALGDVIGDLDPSQKDNKRRLMECYEDSARPAELELRIGGSVFRLGATPFASHGDFRARRRPTDSSSNSDRSTDSNQGKGPAAVATGSKNDRFLMVFKDISEARARARAEEKARDKATMAKAMAESMVTLTHELRTPLQGIMGVTSLMLQQQTAAGVPIDDPSSPGNEETLESLKLIMASSSLLLNLINNLLDVKKATATMMEDFLITPVVASGPIRDAVGFCQPLAAVSDVKVATDLSAAQHAVVLSNTLRLQQVLINLLSNAIKHTKSGGRVRVSVRPATVHSAEELAHQALAASSSPAAPSGAGGAGGDAPVLLFAVADQGAGIAPSQAGRLFRRFERLDAAPTRTLGVSGVGQPSGTGLGLHLCQILVERMSGRLWAMNNRDEGGGSTFSFYLPLVPGESPRAIISEAKGGSAADDRGIPDSRHESCSLDRPSRLTWEAGDKTPASRYRVLLVDDTLINRKVFDRMLKRVGIPTIVTVESGKRALEELAKHRYDLVITDLQMPGMSGTELSYAINSPVGAQLAEDSPLPPVVVGLTADTGADVAERCASSGMADVLYKPITLAEMRDYFEITFPRLRPGVWHANEQKTSFVAKSGLGP